MKEVPYGNAVQDGEKVILIVDRAEGSFRMIQNGKELGKVN
jgi:hypothetical protein